ncbi:MAG TPA: Ig-like domain repeat protein [Candidatus Limnocylindria bacterium]|nr:Ig-like domain repeat protein [Candidatus Limnocylindria bacterium]
MVSARRRVLSGSLLGLLFTLLSASVAVAAFAPQPGFSATNYATLPAGGTSTGVAFIGTVMYSLDSASGQLYATASAGTTVAVGTPIGGAPAGMAASGGSLYVTRRTPNDIVKVDPATGAFTTVVLSAAVADTVMIGVAADAAGNLFVATAAGYIWTVPTAPTIGTPSIDTQLTGNPAVYGIAVDSAGTLYVSVTTGAANGIWQIKGPIGARTSTGSIGAPVSGARGVGIIPGYVLVNNTDGSITKLIVPGVGSGADALALTGGLVGDLGAIGTDGCFYASQGNTVVRLADANGLCNLGNAAPPPPAPTLVLARTSTNAPYIGNGDQTFTATLTNVPAPDGTAVNFTVTRGTTSTVYPALAGPTGVASFSYAATAIGTDTITASAVINSTLITSNAVSITYTRALDFIVPTITYTVTGAHNTGPAFACPQAGIGTPGVVEYCGWYTSQPVVHWNVTTTGPSGAVWNCPDYVLLGNSPSTGTPTTCFANNGDGKGSTSLTVYLQALTTPPTITASATTPNGPYTGGWTNQNVTVSFACASDPTFGPASPIVSCTPPVTVSAEGTTTLVSGTVLDIAGTTASTTYGPIKIDKTPPTISVAAKLADNTAYTFGQWTSQDVTLTFTCADPGTVSSGVASCPPTQTITSTRGITPASVTDNAGNVVTIQVGAINIDKTVPTIVATATAGASPYSGASPTNQTVVVTFACGTDGAPVTCPPAQTYAGEGTFTASGTATDAAGNSATASFGPFSIDLTAPTITVVATLADGSPYGYGAWTTQNVRLTFACADAAGIGPSGVATCPTDTTVSATQAAFTATVTDRAGNIATAAVGPINIDRTPPTITAAATVGGVAYSGTSATSGPVVVAYTCGTDGAPVTCPAAVTYTLPGTYTATATATDAAGNIATASFGPFTILATQPTTLTITSLPRLPRGATIVTAKLLAPGGVPVVGRTVQFAAGTVTATGVTNASGVATATLTLKKGRYILTATFAGDGAYLASTAKAVLVVVAKAGDDDDRDKDGKGDRGTDGNGDGGKDGKGDGGKNSGGTESRSASGGRG